MRVSISCEAECCGSELAHKVHAQLSAGRYNFPASVMPLPLDMEAHLAEHRTFRKRAARARNRGYGFSPIDRALYEDDVYDINTSAPERQGRPMSEGYRRRPRFGSLGPQPCDRHGVHTYGVLQGLRLRAYTWIYRVGELVMVSSILGHAAHLDNDIMYELMRGALTVEAGYGPGFVFYNRHDSGTEGLRYFKEKLGLEPARVEWRLR